MSDKFTVEKYIMEEHTVYTMGPSKASCRHTTIVPKKDIAGFLYYILPDVTKQSLEDFPYGESIAMAIKLASDHGKDHIKFQNTDEKLKKALADLVKKGVLRESWGNHQILLTPPAPIVESFSVKILD